MRTRQILTTVAAVATLLSLAPGAVGQAGSAGAPAPEGPATLWERFPLERPPAEAGPVGDPSSTGAQAVGQGLLLGLVALGAALLLAGAAAALARRRRRYGARRVPGAVVRFLSAHEADLVLTALTLGAIVATGLLVLVATS